MRNISKIALFVRMLSVAYGCYLAIAVSSANAAAPSVTIDEIAEVIAIKPDMTLTNADGESLTKEVELSLTVAGATSGGVVTPFINNVPQTPVTMPAAVPIVLTKEGPNLVNVSYTYTVAGVKKKLVADPIIVELDTVGPLLEHAEVIEVPSTGTTLIVTFAEDDFQAPISVDAFEIGRKDRAGVFTADTFSPQSATIQGRTIRLPFAVLPPGDYQLTVKGDGELRDKVGNYAGGSGDVGNKKTWLFTVLSERKFAEHVEFTPYAPPTKQTIPTEGFNPGDYVETRVARLFYFRDAHRVAEIVNRNIRSYNRAAVTQAERRAENAREEAEDATDERREKERAAVSAANQARTAEQQLAQAQQTLAVAQNLESDMREDTLELERLKAAASTEPVDVARSKQLETRIEQNDLALTSIGSSTELAVLVNSMQQSVANLRQTELLRKEEWENAEAKEAGKRAVQFRKEVTAADTDPDTYVAGDMHSADPVTQCSLSVIGEGLIQIRGPIKGINKIRTMINQIDSPVGQIKVGIFTVQINGEQGDKMEKVAGDAEGAADLSRFLVNQSLNLLRRSIQTEAALIAEQCNLEGHYQVDRDRRYLYGFFGRDFIDELYEMNSEFLFSENKLLSLHSMDTVSFNRAMFILALAKNDVRERIVNRFLEAAKTELPDAEFDFRRSSELKPHQTEKHFPFWNRTHLPVANHHHKEQLIHEAVHRNAQQRYHFRNFSSYFDAGFTVADTMNPMQREFIRMAQIFKARLIAEMEWKQRVMERGLIEDRSNDEEALYKVIASVRDKAYGNLREAYEGMLESKALLMDVTTQLNQIILDLEGMPSDDELEEVGNALKQLKPYFADFQENLHGALDAEFVALHKSYYDNPQILEIKKWLATFQNAKWLTQDQQELINFVLADDVYDPSLPPAISDLIEIMIQLPKQRDAWTHLKSQSFRSFENVVSNSNASLAELDATYYQLVADLSASPASLKDTQYGSSILAISEELYQKLHEVLSSSSTVNNLKLFLEETRVPLDHRKLLDHMIDEQEEKFIELVEGTRSHIAVMDQYLKRLSIALEDDFKVQFYDPAFVRVRDAARGEAVNLSQVERTTILTNNRAFAKVDPQATMEFDLPKRQIAIKEAFDAAKALVEDTGALVNDPTFLSAFQMMGGAAQPTTVKNVIPSQSMSTDQHIMGLVPPPPVPSSPGSALQSLVPEPAIYKLETGTGFQLRPVMQPDGDSAVYDFDYMYTTNIREPVRADEKHVGRIKRHFVHTEVQTGNFELREISRYQVALKVSRTSQGVPMLQNIPLVGRAFRPAPSAESSLQQNIIFGQTNLYPTLYDLMGLRWAQQVVDLDHTSLLESEHVIRGRQKAMRNYVFEVASRRVDEFLNVQCEAPNSYRTDLYHEQSLSSPYHPNGYRHPTGVADPTGHNYERRDRRPPEMQDPPYDRYRHQPVHPERIGPGIAPESIEPIGAQPTNRTREESRFNDYYESTSMSHRLPDAELQEPKMGLSHESQAIVVRRGRMPMHPDLTEAGRQDHAMSDLESNLHSQHEAMQQLDRKCELRPVQHVPSLGRVPLDSTRSQSAVLPASFEQYETSQHREAIQSRAPVEFHLSD